ncbi:MAG: hypothetical protein IPO37_05230 [Saprospiraceae bacterium]|nr:hypothetical protein [Saprospiraceae bacterium]
MYNFLKSSHSYFAYVAFAAIIIALLIAIFSMINKKSYSGSNLKTAMFGMIACHIQLLFGLVLYFVSPYGFQNLSGETMKDSFSRLLAVEHPFVNILAIIIITIGFNKAKKAMASGTGNKAILIYYGIGLLLLLSRVPWSQWL